MFRRVSGVKLYEEVIRQIKEMISRGELRKGDRLPSENELTQMMHVSRITVREALRILSNMGIIETQKGRGSFVLVDGGSQEVQKIFLDNIGEFKANYEYSNRLRLILEPAVAREAARSATESDIEKLESLLIVNNPDSLEMDEFHLCLLSIVDDRYMMELLEKCMDLERTPMKVEMLKPEQQKQVKQLIDRQHRQIVDAVRTHDEEFAYFYMKEHISSLFHIYQEYFDCFLE